MRVVWLNLGGKGGAGLFLQRLEVEGFKSFGTHFEVEFAEGLNVLVGENGVGKSAVVDALRLILHEDEFGRNGIDDTDFHCQFHKNSVRCESIGIVAHFAGLSRDEQVAFLPWTDLRGNATLSLRVDGPPTIRGRYRRVLWGGVSKNAIFESELMNTINCVYVPPLRDAEARLREGRGSRLARLLKNMNRTILKDEKNHPLVVKVAELNKDLAKDKRYSIAEANERIAKQLEAAVGEVFGQDTNIQFAEASFNRIVESLRLLFFPFLDANPSTEQFRTLDENSLGYNNLLYLATILAELTPVGVTIGESEYLRVLLIEEPEAHLHPQLQTRLLKFVEGKAKEAGIQVIVTTHSPVLASAVSINSIIHLSGGANETPKAIQISKCELAPKSSAFISRWLDATKSILLFAKGIILVEGIAEALLLPEIARRVLRSYNAAHNDRKLAPTLADAGVSVINMGGIFFQHFMQLFSSMDGSCTADAEKDADNTDNKDGANEEAGKTPSASDYLLVRCAGITDNDPPDQDTNGELINPVPSNPIKGLNTALQLKDKLKGANCFSRLYSSPLKTLEYDLAMEKGNLGVMLQVLSDLWPSQTGGVVSGITELNKRDWAKVTDEKCKAEAARELLTRVDDDKNIGKGIFAQALAEKLASDDKLAFAVPKYIRDAVLWAMGRSDEENR